MSETIDAKEIRVILTNIGAEMMAKALQGIPAINFVSMKFGNGIPDVDVRTLSDLVNPLIECGLDNMERGENYIILTSSFTNGDVDDDFMMSEIGVFAKDENEEKHLFAYINQSDYSEPVFARDSQKILENVINIYLVIDSSANVTASIRSLIYTTKEEFDAHKNNVSNPHSVTKEQIGLGNVENKAANDLEITFDEKEEDDDNVASGDKLSLILLKLFTAIKTLKAHLINKNNPHGLTTDTIGAAKKTHTHSAADVNGGTFSVGRGGTGKGTWEKDKLIYASETTELSQLQPPDKPSFLMQDETGAPYFKNADTLSASDVGLGNVKNERQYSANNPPPTDTTRQSKITVSGILKGDGNGGVSAAVAGTDYLKEHQSLAAYRKSSAQDTIDNGKQKKITASGILKGDGNGGVSAAVAGTDYTDVKVAKNVSVSNWAADSTYADYPYRASVPITGVTADHIPSVTFGLTEAKNGKYAPIAESYAGGVYLYAKVNTAITVPSIVCQKGV